MSVCHLFVCAHLFCLTLYDVPVVTSFEYALRDIELLDELAWSLVIVDEVHKAKNHSSGTTKALHLFKSGLRFGLTGTAIQNSYMELWTILDWCNPKKLGTRAHWKKIVVTPLTIGQSAKASEEQRIKAIVGGFVMWAPYMSQRSCLGSRRYSQE